MNEKEYEEIIKIIDSHMSPLWTNTGMPYLVLTNSEWNKAKEEIRRIVK